ncbi:MAG: hypothetical protein COZ31_08780 [Nitrospirae bacterium CG_4_10_14_3_um_filter_44_29]|nr:MAG: hypothetical protein COS28_07250 [Nitrospirae bacterium CG02_land_8_20_14_3_00_44_33]PIX87739.1 MAG: hypothetical protein COZ31_08780 [Nitrospirae bacterium CG_4_10_14_3_um_filter_44_29]
MADKKPFKNLKPESIKSKKSKPAGVSEKFARLLDIYTRIAQNKYPSAKSLAEKYEVAEKTIYRYLEAIRDIDPIEFDNEKRGYKFVNGDRIKKLILTDNELLLLLTMSEAVSHLGEPLKRSFQELIEDVTNVRKVPRADTGSPIVIKMPYAIETEKLSGYFETIVKCINEKRSIDIVYKALHSKETTERRIDPYGIVLYEGAWILIGYCHLKDAVRHFALDRILDLKEKWLYFEPKDSFSLEGHFSLSWGIYDDNVVDVTVRFSSKVAEYITRKEKWHPSEKREILPNGDVELTFSVAGTSEIKHWIYSWIPNVEVLKPEWFREQVSKELSASLENHRRIINSGFST